jgi:glutamyl-tRNA synthetase
MDVPAPDTAPPTCGRFAPSPTGALHLGNLRTALVAWLSARAQGGRFLVRMEDLDRVTSSPDHAARQLGDLAAIGLDWDEEVVFQSERFDRYEATIATLETAGLTYPCYCTRREIREAASAPHGPAVEGRYPGTCRDLSPTQRAERESAGRRPAVRLRTDGEHVAFDDLLLGPVAGPVDDIVLRRNDGVPAYNLAVVVDDAAQGVTEVVRGDDLVPATPSQVHLARLLGVAPPVYGHVPLALGADGQRLAKRQGAVTLEDLAATGVTPADALAHLAVGLRLAAPGEAVTVDRLLARFSWATLPRDPWLVHLPDS